MTVSEVIRVVTNKPCPLWAPNAKLDLHAVGDRCLKCEGEKFIVEYHDAQTAYDAAQSELAALREELARKDVVIEDMLESNSDMTTCLAAAEQRNSALIAALTYLRDTSDDSHVFEKAQDALNENICSSCVGSKQERVLGRDNSEFVIDCSICTQPTESGASE